MKKIIILLTTIFFLTSNYLAAQRNSLFHSVKAIDKRLELISEQINLLKIKHESLKLISFNTLEKHHEKGKIKFKLDGIGTVHFRPTYVDFVSDEEFEWHGETFSKKVYGSCTIIRKNGKTYGNLQVDQRKYTIIDLDHNIQALAEIKNSPDKLAASGCVTKHMKEKDKIASPRSCSNVIDVLVVFTSAANQYMNGHTAASLFVSKLNESLRRSNIQSHQINFRLVGSFLSGPAESSYGGIWPYCQNLMANASDPNQFVYQKRAELGADIVVALTDGFNSYGVVPSITPTWQEGVAVVEIDEGLGRLTFPHEVAHLLGAGHDTTPPSNRGHGWIYSFLQRNRTIMSTNTWHGPRIPNFSNPDITIYHYGLPRPTGTTTRDNVSAMLNGSDNLACFSDNYAPAPPNFDVYIFGPQLYFPFGPSSTSWSESVQGCTNIQSRQWSWSSNGLSYYNLSTGSSIQGSQIPIPSNTNRIFIKLTVTCSTGQTKTRIIAVDIDWTQLSINDDSGGIESISDNKIKYNTHAFGTESISDVEIRPNPTSGSLNISFDNKDDVKDAKIVIVSANGFIMKSSIQMNLIKGMNYLELDISNLKTGQYRVQIITKSNIISKKLIKF